MTTEELNMEAAEAAENGAPMTDRTLIARLCGVVATLERKVEVLENELENHKTYHPGQSEPAW